MKPEPLRKIFLSEKSHYVEIMKTILRKLFTDFFRNCFEVSGKSHSAEKCKRGDPLGFFERPFCCKISKKMKGGHFGDIKKFAKKSLTKPKLHAQRKFGQG